jgi:hypothetical protein
VAEFVKFTPKIEEIPATDKHLLFNPVVRQNTKKQLELLNIEL